MDTVASITNQIDMFKKGYNKLNWGNDWKSEKTYDSVCALEKLNYISIVNSILELPSFDDKFNLSIVLAEYLVTIIFDAETNAFKLVNGSLGEWCPDAATHICDMLNNVVQSYDASITKTTHITTVCTAFAGIKQKLDYYAHGIVCKWEK